MNRPMNRTTTTLSVIALSAALVAATAWAQSPTPVAATASATDVVRTLEAAGYRDIRGLELDDGLWEADAISPRGFAIELTIDPATGRILDPEPAGGVSAEQVRASLSQQGYSDIRALELDGSRVETEARDAQGQWVELELDAITGAVLSAERDD